MTVFDELIKKENKKLRSYFMREVLVFLNEEMFVSLSRLGGLVDISNTLINFYQRGERGVNKENFIALYNIILRIYGPIWDRIMPTNYFDLKNFLENKYQQK